MEYGIGDKVFVSLPLEVTPTNPAHFNAGWNNRMYRYINTCGTIASSRHKANPGEGYDYLINFEDGGSWYWDERYISSEAPAVIEESEFDSILN